MRLIKISGLAGLAALMAMAFVGASTAIAGSTTLCKVDESPCSPGNQISHVHEVTIGKAKLLTNLITVECDALFLGDVSGATLNNPLSILGNFTYTNCGSCDVYETSAKSAIGVLRTAHELAEVAGEGRVFVDCGAFVECEYIGKGLKGHGLGPLLAQEGLPKGSVSISEGTTINVGGFFCPEKAKLDIATTPLTTTYISI